jgi:hypothetical protein
MLGVCTIAFVAAGCGGGSSDTNAAATVKRVSGPTQASLHPVGGSDVSGKVVYVEQPSGLPLMKVRLRGLEKATGEAQYFIWQVESRHNMISFASYHLPRGSTLSVNLEPNPESLSWLKEGSTTQMLITRVEDYGHFFAAREHWPSPEDPTEIGIPVAHGTFTGPLVGESPG